MELIVRLADPQQDREEKVRVRRSGDGYEVVVGDRVWQVDAAADLYPFFVLTSWFTDPQLFSGRMQDILLTETALTSRVGRLADTWSFPKRGFDREEIEFDEGHALVGGIGVTLHITERKLREEELRQTRERLAHGAPPE